MLRVADEGRELLEPRGEGEADVVADTRVFPDSAHLPFPELRGGPVRLMRVVEPLRPNLTADPLVSESVGTLALALASSDMNAFWSNDLARGLLQDDCGFDEAELSFFSKPCEVGDILGEEDKDSDDATASSGTACVLDDVSSTGVAPGTGATELADQSWDCKGAAMR